MDITRDASGAIGLTTDGDAVVWYINEQNVTVKNTDTTITIIFENRVLELPIEGLTINGTPFSGNGKQGAELVATTVFYGI